MLRSSDPSRARYGTTAVVALTLMASGCAPGEDEEAAAACTTFQHHLDAMRESDERAQGLELARDAAATAQQSDDDELAAALEDYQQVIVRFALAEDDLEGAQARADDASEADLADVEDDLAETEDRLAGLIEAGDLVLSHITAGCEVHDVVLE